MNEWALAAIALCCGLVLGLLPSLLHNFTIYLVARIGAYAPKSNRPVVYGALTLLYTSVGVILLSSILFYIITEVPTYTDALLVLMPIISIIGGLWYARHFLLPRSHNHSPLRSYVHTVLVKSNGILMPIIVSAQLLWVIAALLVPALSNLALIGILFNYEAFIWAIPFAVGFITPLYAIYSLVMSGTNGAVLLSWLHKKTGTLYLYSGIVLVFIGWFTWYAVIIWGVK